MDDDATLWEQKQQLDALNRNKQIVLQFYADSTKQTGSTNNNNNNEENKNDGIGTMFCLDHDTTPTAISTTTSLDASQALTEKEAAIWKARLLLVVAAALYGTNFSLVKVLGDTMPVGVSAALRFGLASFLTLPWLLQPPNNNNQGEDADAARGAMVAGFEVGMWNSIGYIAQAVGLATTDASKVRRCICIVGAVA